MFRNYTSNKVSFTKKEFLIALFLNLVFVVGTLFSVQPFKAFIDMGESIKDGWTKEYGEPPYGHAEETKLRVFCRKMNIDLEKAKAVLEENGIVFKENETLKTIAIVNSIAPSDVYKMIKTKSKSSHEVDGISNMGRKTLQDLSDMKMIDLNHAMEILKAKGLDNISAERRLKHIGDELDITPVEVYKLIKNS